MESSGRFQVTRVLERTGGAESEEDEYEYEQFQPRFACPHCYEQFEITNLCVHLVDEHVSDSTKFVLCPVCANEVGEMNLVNHMTVQHGPLFAIPKTKKPRKTPSREYQPVTRSGRELHDYPADRNAKPPPVVVPSVEDVVVRKPVPATKSFKSRIDFSLGPEEKELRHKRSLVRASFACDLIFSTLFGE